MSRCCSVVCRASSVVLRTPACYDFAEGRTSLCGALCRNQARPSRLIARFSGASQAIIRARRHDGVLGGQPHHHRVALRAPLRGGCRRGGGGRELGRERGSHSRGWGGRGADAVAAGGRGGARAEPAAVGERGDGHDQRDVPEAGAAARGAAAPAGAGPQDARPRADAADDPAAGGGAAPEQQRAAAAARDDVRRLGAPRALAGRRDAGEPAAGAPHTPRNSVPAQFVPEYL